MKISKLALYLVLLPIGVIAVASSLFLATFDANDYKQELVDYVKKSSGRSLIFKGDAELMLYPEFGMKLGAMEFSNAPGFGAKPMLSVEEVSISVDVKSVLMLEPKVSQLILSELHIDLQKNKKGVTNWDDLVPKKAKEAKTSNPVVADKDKDEERSEFELAGAFEGININNAQVSWRDAVTGQSMSIDDLDFTTGKITPTESFPLSLHLLMHQQKDIKADINFETNVFFDLKTQTLHLKNLDLHLKASGDLIPVNQSDVTIKGDVKFDMDKQLLNVSKLELEAKTNGGVMEKTQVNLSADFAMDLNTQTLGLSQLQLKADIVDVSMPKGQLIASIKSEQLDVYLKQRKIDLKQLELGLNKLHFKGEVHVKDYAQPALSLNLSAQELDLDEFLGLSDKPSKENNEPVKDDGKAVEDTEIALPVDLLRTLEINAQFNIAKLKVMNVVTTNNQLTVQASKGLLQVKPLSLAMYQGTLTNEVSLDVRSDVPKYGIKTNLNAVQIGDLLIDFMQLDKIRGASTIAIDVTTEGTWVSELKQHLNGSVALRFEDGALKGLNLRHLSDVAKAKFTGSKEPSESLQETDFTELKLSGEIKKGVFYSDDLSLKSPLIRVGGKGQVDLNNNSVDYTVNTKIIASLEGQTGEGLEASGLLIPVRIFGPFIALETDILLDNMLRQQANEKLSKTKAALKAKQQAASAELAKRKAEFKAEQQAKINAEKEAIKAKQDKQKAAFEAKKAAEKKKLDAKVKAAEDKAKKKLESQLKGLFN